jgi:branched-chain amino acid aminotransferase
MKSFCFAKSEIINSRQAQIHPSDIAILRGYAIFDFFRVVDHIPLFLSKYLDRFIGSADKAGLRLVYDKPVLKEIIFQLIEKNSHREGGMRMVLTGGISENHFLPHGGDLFIFCEPLQMPAPEKYENGVKLLSVNYVRPIPDIKTTNYTYPCYLSLNWQAQKAEDVIYHHQGKVSESSRSNIFMVKGNEIITPASNILKGITREQVMRLSGTVKVEDFSLEELLQADEAFMSSTTKRILPITRIDEHRIGNGKPGPTTKQLMKAFYGMEQEIPSRK